MTSTKEDEMIITLVKENVCLYNKKNANYYKNKVKMEIYEQIAGFLEMKLNSKLSRMYYKLRIYIYIIFFFY